MKSLFYSLLVFANLLCLFTAGGKPMDELTIKIKQVLPSGSISVEVDNASSKPVRIWKESNSWGAARWRVLLIRGDKLKTLFQTAEGFTRNVPGFDEIAAGGHVEKKLDLNGGRWEGSDGAKIAFEPGDTIIVVYDVPKEFGWSDSSIADNVRKMGVWHGVIAASTVFR